MRDSTEVHKTLIHHRNNNWQYALVYDEPASLRKVNPDKHFYYRLARNKAELTKILDRERINPSLHPEIWERKIEVVVSTLNDDPELFPNQS